MKPEQLRNIFDNPEWNENSYSRLYEEAACGLVLTKSDGSILLANQTFCNWLGYQKAELASKRFQSLFSVGSRLFHYTHWAPLLSMQGSVSEVQIEMICASNKKIPILLNARTRVVNTETFHELALFITYDRSKYEQEILIAKKAAEGALAEKNEAEQFLKEQEVKLLKLNEELNHAHIRKDEFLATLAHELRNPLAPLRNVLEILKLKKLADPSLERFRLIMDRQVSILTHLVDDLMEVTRVSQGRLKLKLTQVDVSKAIIYSIESAQAEANAFGHKLELTLPSELLMVKADETRLIQMILNLLNNAIKYTPGGGTIWISAEKQEAQVSIKIKDTGIGIEKDQQQSIFQMFSQVESALERSKGGLGIGLALVSGLAMLHNGSISVFSEGLGLGSEFELCLPLDDSTNIVHEVEVSRPIAGKNKRILVIDDNKDITYSLSLTLEMSGFDVEAANSGIDGLALGRGFLPQIILLDIGLPDMNGFEVAQKIRHEGWGKSLTLIAVTGWGQQHDVHNALSAGFDHHITKPIDFRVLNEILSSAELRNI